MKIRKYIELNDNEHNTYQNSKDAAKAVHRKKCIALNLYVKKKKLKLIKLEKIKYSKKKM